MSLRTCRGGSDLEEGVDFLIDTTDGKDPGRVTSTRASGSGWTRDWAPPGSGCSWTSTSETPSPRPPSGPVLVGARSVVRGGSPGSGRGRGHGRQQEARVEADLVASLALRQIHQGVGAVDELP